MTIFYDFTYREMLLYRRPLLFYTEDQVMEAVENPAIIHFTTSFLSKRAWIKGCMHRYVGEWLKYKKMSPWATEVLWEDNRPQWRQIGAEIIRKLPRGLGIRLAGFMQVYGRPVINKMKYGIRHKYI